MPKPDRNSSTNLTQSEPGKKRKAAVKAVPKSRKKPAGFQLSTRLLLITLEILSLVALAIYGIMGLLGYSANWWSGTRLLNNLLPFAGAVLLLIVITAGLLIGWWQLRIRLQRRLPQAAPLLPLGMGMLVGWLVLATHPGQVLANFRTLVGGKQEAGRVNLAHQVYAAYRRQDAAQLKQLLERAQPYHTVITEAARAFNLDSNLLQGIAAAESSFLPRNSADGGQGLFQITQVPKSLRAIVAKRLQVSVPDPTEPRHNAYLAAATFKFYLEQMNNDLFLGLLAYNIGPANGGLRFIMQQYGATDFIAIQPYLQSLPRDYPIRVLTYALAFRIQQQQGRLLAYEEGKNAYRIQALGIPGLAKEF